MEPSNNNNNPLNTYMSKELTHSKLARLSWNQKLAEDYFQVLHEDVEEKTTEIAQMFFQSLKNIVTKIEGPSIVQKQMVLNMNGQKNGLNELIEQIYQLYLEKHGNKDDNNNSSSMEKMQKLFYYTFNYLSQISESDELKQLQKEERKLTIVSSLDFLEKLPQMNFFEDALKNPSVEEVIKEKVQSDGEKHVDLMEFILFKKIDKIIHKYLVKKGLREESESPIVIAEKAKNITMDDFLDIKIVNFVAYHLLQMRLYMSNSSLFAKRMFEEITSSASPEKEKMSTSCEIIPDFIQQTFNMVIYNTITRGREKIENQMRELLKKPDENKEAIAKLNQIKLDTPFLNSSIQNTFLVSSK